MSTTLSTLQANPELMRQAFTKVFESMDAADLIALKYEIAHDHLKQDLYRVFRIDSTDSSQLTDLDTIIDKYSIQFQRALMFLQCYYYFSDNDDTEGLNAKRMSICLNNYDACKAFWNDYTTDSMATTTLAIITRG